MRRFLRWMFRATVVGAAVLAVAVGVVFLIPVRTTVAAIAPRADTQYWQMQGGYRIAYTRLAPAAGAPRRLPVVFLHGGPGGYVHSSIIQTLQPLADAGHEVFLYDQRGSGLSDRLPRPKDSGFNDQIADLHEIVGRQLGVERVALVGQSHGARLAAYYAARHPEKVARLVLGSPANLEPAEYDEQGRAVVESRYPIPETLDFRIPDPEQYRRDTGLSAMPAKVILAQAFAMAFNVKTVSDAEADAALNTLAAGFTRNMVCDPKNVKPEEGGAGVYVRTGANWFGDVEDPRPQMRRFPGPVLVLQGQCDFVPYAEAYEYVDLFPDARYQFIPGGGHILWWEQPEAYVRHIAGFLSEDASQRGQVQ
ncbi:alpha/beta fold hydrolase [Arenimonas terrae]|nr:alpha/beta hydrolase [Arenimonas terrae]